MNDLITKPTFYPDLRSAAMSSFGMMKQLYPLYDDNLFNEFLRNSGIGILYGQYPYARLSCEVKQSLTGY